MLLYNNTSFLLLYLLLLNDKKKRGNFNTKKDEYTFFAKQYLNIGR